MYLLLGFCFMIIVVLLILTSYFQEKMIFFPETLPENHKFTFTESFQELFFETEKNVKINGLLFQTENPKGIILYFHGNAGSLNSWGYIASDFTTKGYDILIIDYRTFGKSTGKLSEEALHHDAKYIYNFLLKKYKEQQIIIYGRSIGTGIATKLTSTHSPRMLILETPFYNFIELAKVHFPFFPNSLLLNYTFRNDLWIKDVKCPVHIFHGTNDEIVPYESGLKLAKIVGNENVLITIPGANHNDLNNYELYHKELSRILN